jgi:hypothetical protein
MVLSHCADVYQFNFQMENHGPFVHGDGIWLKIEKR